MVALLTLPVEAYTISISPTPAQLPPATAYQNYTVTFSASGGVGSYSWSCISGCDGSNNIMNTTAFNPLNPFVTTLMVWSPSTATVSGIPDGCGSFDNATPTPCPNPFEPMMFPGFTIQVTDSNNIQAQATYQLSEYWNPSQAGFESQQAAKFSQMVTDFGAGTQQPPIKVGGQHQISNAVYRQPNYDSSGA